MAERRFCKIGVVSGSASKSELIHRAVVGETTAMERLLLDHYQVLHLHIDAQLPRSMRTIVDVEDMLQETFSEAFVSIRRFESRGPGSFATWLRAIATHRIRDAVKRHHRQKRDARREIAPVADAGSLLNLLDNLAGSGSTPSSSAARHEAARFLQIAIASLPEDYRQAIHLRHWEKLRVEEIAEAMGRTTNAVRGLLDRAKKKLREALGRSSQFFDKKQP